MRAEFLRYSCQMALPGFNETAQIALQQAKVLIVGAGGLGCPAAQYLVAVGVGTIGIADFDTISTRNLHRQILYTPKEVGLKKTTIACQKLQEQNPQIKLVPHDLKLTSQNVRSIVQQYDIVLDGTDNFETRYLLNDTCVLEGKPLVYGAIYQYEGQVSIWNILNNDGTRTPNYRDLFPKISTTPIPNCAEGGVIPTLAGIIGCMQANEVIKYITKTGKLLAGKLLLIDVQTGQSRIIKTGNQTKVSITGLTETLDIPTISAQELKKALEEKVYELIDVRSMEEHMRFNIGGRSVPLSELEKDVTFSQSTKPVIFYCTSGKRSMEAVKRIKMKFPEQKVFSLEGGLKAWEEQEVLYNKK